MFLIFEGSKPSCSYIAMFFKKIGVSVVKNTCTTHFGCHTLSFMRCSSSMKTANHRAYCTQRV